MTTIHASDISAITFEVIDRCLCDRSLIGVYVIAVPVIDRCLRMNSSDAFV